MSTLIGPSIEIIGDLSGAEDTTVVGTLRGRIDLQADLRIERPAEVAAGVEAWNIEVAGDVCGDVRASRSVTFEAESRMSGTCEAARIRVSEDAEVDATLSVRAGIGRTRFSEH